MNLIQQLFANTGKKSKTPLDQVRGVFTMLNQGINNISENAKTAVKEWQQKPANQFSNFMVNSLTQGIRDLPQNAKIVSSKASNIIKTAGKGFANYQTPTPQGNVPIWLKPFNDVYKSQLDLSKQIFDPIVRSYGNTAVRATEPQKLKSTYTGNKWALAEDIGNVLPIIPIGAFTKTKPIMNLFQKSIQESKSATQALKKIDTVFDTLKSGALKKKDVNGLQSIRASIVNQINALTGGGGAGYKSDFALRKTMLNDPETGILIRSFEDKIADIDDQIKTFVKPLVNKVKQTIPEFTYKAGEILDNLPPSSVLRKNKGAFTNVREIDNPMVRGKAFMDTLREANIQKDPIGTTPLSKKINIWDKLFATPDRVMEKIGLKPQMTYLRQQFDKYTSELPQEIGRITAWSKRVPKEANEQIFDWLDGKPAQLNGENLKVATEIKAYLKTWAQKLGLPEEKRITNYITHIFEKGSKLEFDEDLAKLIDEKIAKSTYDPFLQTRKGNPEYIRDTWQALDAYVKRASRKYNLDPALSTIENASKDFELSQYKYVKNYIDRVNLRPTEIDITIDNSIKQLIGYKFGERPLTVLSQKARQAVFRGLIGLNPATALKNLSQGANTYAKLGEKYTINGYVDFIKSVMTKSDELERVGVLKNSFISDRTINATKRVWETIDKGLFWMFESAEKINRGSAYFGAKAKGLSQGMNETEAIEFAKKIVRDTQFVFGSIDTPPAFQSDLGKTLLQFQSFSIKQVEFLKDMVQKKEFAGLARYTLASLAFATTIGKLFGMELKDIIPSFRIGAPPTLAFPYEIGKAVTNAPDKYGQQRSVREKLEDIGGAGLNYIPGGNQLKKSFQGLQAYTQGKSLTPTGRTRFEVPQTPSNLIRSALFGQWNTPEGRKYIQNLGKSKGQVLYEDLKKMGPEIAAKRAGQLKTQNPEAYKSLTGYLKDQKMKLSGDEKNMRSLPVKDLTRAKRIVEEINSLDTPQKKAETYRRYKEAGIITEEVAEQLAIAKRIGVLK